MKRFLLSKPGLVSCCAFVLLMGFMLNRLSTRSQQRERDTARGDTHVTQAQAGEAAHTGQKTPPRTAEPKNNSKEPGRSEKPPPIEEQNDGAKTKSTTAQTRVASIGKEPTNKPSRLGVLQENLSYLDQSRSTEDRSRKDKDAQGRVLTRRKTARPGEIPDKEETPQVNESRVKRTTLRLAGQTQMTPETEEVGAPGDSTAGLPSHTSSAQAENRGDQDADPECFCPYGRPIKCELVFTLDSTMEETPIIGLVMEPVYNNGRLVIPAGAELHGMARPDRLRDRIFSASDWVLVLPRSGELPNGRELRVKGLALDRAEPDTTGLTWGITDGSNGLQGEVIRTLQNEEIKRFAAGFIAASALGLQEREATARGGSRFSSSPANAALQGLSATMEDLARKIAAEVERNGVFIRVPGGKQFYFYPQQAIHPLRARIPAGRETDTGPRT